MLYWQAMNQWAHLRPGCQKGDGKAIAENHSELPVSIAGAGDIVLIHRSETLRCVSLLCISTTRKTKG